MSVKFKETLELKKSTSELKEAGVSILSRQGATKVGASERGH